MMFFTTSKCHVVEHVTLEQLEHHVLAAIIKSWMLVSNSFAQVAHHWFWLRKVRLMQFKVASFFQFKAEIFVQTHTDSEKKPQQDFFLKIL